MMAEKSQNLAAQLPISKMTRTVMIFSTIIFVSMMVLALVINDSTLSSFVQVWKSSRNSFSGPSWSNEKIIANAPSLAPQTSPSNMTSNSNDNVTLSNVNDLPKSLLKQEVNEIKDNMDKEDALNLNWVSVELLSNYTVDLVARWLAPGGEPCKDSKTFDIKFLNLDDSHPITFETGYAHEIFFQALDEAGNSHCLGGDYFEIDLSGEQWKSRPPLKDLGNGTYSFILQVHPNFVGNYQLTLFLLFRHFEGLAYSPTRFAINKQLRRIPITFLESKVKLPELHACRKTDFERSLWAGRWTRHARNDTCEVSHDGRFRCLEPNLPCTLPWCSGSLGSLESNGWVYSTHCSFKLFSLDESWHCLNNKWLFFWGDSNHVDTVRNIMIFFLGMPNNQLVTRRFDMNITNPRNESQWVRITNIFNGHWDDKSNYLGLDSLSNKGYRETIKGYFNGSVVPDVVVFNSGLHDACYWPNIRRFAAASEHAAKFWADVIQEARRGRSNVPEFVFRSTVAAGGHARTLAFNPNKIEAYNGVLLDKLRATGIVSSIIDDFDMKWAWHFDNQCTDGVHYGRAPSKRPWWGYIGHQYFVDLMLGHVLLNVICGN